MSKTKRRPVQTVRPYRVVPRSWGGGSVAGRRAVGLLGVLLATATSVPAAERRVVVGNDGREPLERAASRLGGGDPETRFAATGMVECGGVRGIGQLTGRGDVVTSAAHVFFDEAGRPRADSGRCVFVTGGPAGRLTIPLRPDPQLCGSTSPYGTSGRHDWALARLAYPVPGVRAYSIGGPTRVGEAIAVVAFEDGRKTVDVCHIRAIVAGPGGGQELRTDCVGFDGMSGAGYLTLDGRPRLVGVHVGFRSATPDAPAAFSDRHYTFGTSIGGGFRAALETAAR